MSTVSGLTVDFSTVPCSQHVDLVADDVVSDSPVAHTQAPRAGFLGMYSLPSIRVILESLQSSDDTHVDLWIETLKVFNEASGYDKMVLLKGHS